jgi:hypothetical protein
VTRYPLVEELNAVKFDQDDRDNAALCAWKEARGEGDLGMYAVLWQLRNRVFSNQFPRNLHDVIYGKNQYTSMSVPSDPEYHLKPEDDDKLSIFAKSCAAQIFTDDGIAKSDGSLLGKSLMANSSGLIDPTNGALYYANLHEVDQDGWFYQNIVLNSKDHPITAQILHHTFFR